jgi:hypothetical protein
MRWLLEKLAILVAYVIAAYIAVVIAWFFSLMMGEPPEEPIRFADVYGMSGPTAPVGATGAYDYGDPYP